MNKIILQEKYNPTRLNYLLSLNLEPDQKTHLEKIKKNLKNSVLVVNYNFGRGKNYGRLYSNIGYQFMKKDYRNFLAREFYDDFDLSNCHPILLKGLLNKYDLKCDMLNDYINNRDKYLKDFDKTDILKAINNSKFFSHPIFKDLHSVIYNKLYPILRKDPKFEIIPDKKKKNEKGSFISNVLQILENDVIQKIRGYLAVNDINFGTLVFDGLLIDKNQEINLKEINEIIKDTNLILIKKDMNSDIIEPEEFEEPESVKDLTDYEVAQLIIKQFENRIINNKGTIYVYHQNKWTYHDINGIFASWIQSCDIDLIQNPKSKNKKLVRDLTNKWPYYIKQLNAYCKTLPEVDLLDKQKDILYFANGYIDLKTNCNLVPYNPKEVYYTTRVCSLSYEDTDTSKMYDILLDIFNNETESLDLVLKFLIRGLTGHVEDKVALLLIGERNSAKGLLVSFLLNSFDKLTNSIPSAELVFKKTLESAERRNGFLGKFCESSLCISEEIPSEKLDGAIWKTITSGGDAVTYRQAFGTTTTSKINALYLLTSNQIPEFNLQDANKTLLTYNMPCKYLDKLPEDDRPLGYVPKIANTKIKSLTQESDYQSAFVKILIKHWISDRPDYSLLENFTQEIVESNNDYQDEKFYIQNAFNSIYKKDPDGRIKTSEVHQKIRTITGGATPYKIKNTLQSMGIFIKRITGYDHYCISEINTVFERE